MHFPGALVEEHDTQKEENCLSETVTSSALPATILEGEDELLTILSQSSTDTMSVLETQGNAGVNTCSVRASWFTAKPAGQDAGAEAKIRGVSPQDDCKVTLRWEYCRQAEWSGLHSGF